MFKFSAPLRRAMPLVLRPLLAACFSLFFSSSAAATILYVKKDAPGARNGSSWANAFDEVQNALSAAAAGDEIWVAAGIYKPTNGTDLTISFVMKSGVPMYGGFAGFETQRAQRNPAAYQSILTGVDITPYLTPPVAPAAEASGAMIPRLDGITLPPAPTRSLNIILGADNAALDGFTVWNSGPMLNDGVSPSISNCIFNACSIDDHNNRAIISRCSFLHSQVFNYQSQVPVADSTFVGSGIYNDVSYSEISRCTFRDFVSQTFAAIENFDSGSSVTDCAFQNVTCGLRSSNYTSHYAPVSVSNCNFANCIGAGISVFDETGAPASVSNCNFGNCAGAAIGGWADVTACVFTGNGAAANGCSSLSHCTFLNSKSVAVSSYGRISGCLFSGNYSAIASDSQPVNVVNCVFTGNAAGIGDGLNGYLILANCTSASRASASFKNASSLTNCIFWSASGPGVFACEGAFTVIHCDIRGSGGSGGAWPASLGSDGGGNIDVDPQFQNPAFPIGAAKIGFSPADGLHLLKNSPCLGAGTLVSHPLNWFPVTAPLTDILGVKRRSPPAMGAYETSAWPSAAVDWRLYQ